MNPEPALAPTLDPANYMDAQVAAITYGGRLMRGADTRSMLGTGYNKKFLVVVPAKEYAVGQDVTFRRRDGTYTTHRVQHVKPGYVWTKGLNNPRGDGWIKVEDVIGRVVWPKPKM